MCLQLLAPERCACGCSVVLTLFDPVNWGLPDLSVCGILEARMLEWAALPSSRGSSPPRDQTHLSLESLTLAGFFFFLEGGFFTTLLSELSLVGQ